MTNRPILGKFDIFFIKAERKLIFALIYMGTLSYLVIRGDYLEAIWLHGLIVFIICLARFGKDFFRTLFFPFIFIVTPIAYYRSKRFINKLMQNKPAEVVIILGRSDWLTYKAWIKPNYFSSELKVLIKYLKKKGQKFSFYPDATIENIWEIMKDTSVKEVYFFGHGDSHIFCLNTNEILYYCDFKKEGIQKEYVHQIHCGTKSGTPLMKYIVPEEHWQDCFFFPEEITGDKIIKEFKQRTEKLDRPYTK